MALTSQQQAQLGSQAMAQMGGGVAAFNPYGAAIGAAAGVATAALEDKVPQNQSSSYNVGYDSSGWAVTIGDGSTSQVDQIKTPNPTAATAAKGLGQVLQNPMVLLAIAAVVGLYFYTKAE